MAGRHDARERGPMITMRRANERGSVRRADQQGWRTFYEKDPVPSLANGFGVLEFLDEDRLAPGVGVSLRVRPDVEVITYVREGTLAQEDSSGHCRVIHAGEFQCAVSGRGVRQTATNASTLGWVHVFQISLRPSEIGLDASHEQKRFSAAQRRGGLRAVASPDGRTASLHLRQDAVVFSALLDPGRHIVHELSPTRTAWLHMVHGEATLGDLVLTTGDGVGISAVRAVSLTARTETEVLLLDLGENVARSSNAPPATYPRRG
jgi:redox-sensitive bicupin YhaK (pirin superfamily)